MPDFPLRLYRLLRERRYDVVHSHVHYFSGVILALAPPRRHRGGSHIPNGGGQRVKGDLRRRAQLATFRRSSGLPQPI
jgi:hypothetical protein